MKNLLTIATTVVVLCFFTHQIHAQAYQQGRQTLNAGLAIGYGTGLSASYDFGVHEFISVGAIGAFTTRNFIGTDRTSFGLGARGSVHLGSFINDPLGIDNDKFDPYAGLLVGFRTENYVNSYTRGLVGLYLGGKYYFQEKLGVYVELGAPYTSLGVTFKF